MSAGNIAQLGYAAQASKADELLDIVLIGAPSFGISEVGEPFDFGRHLREITELGRRQAVPINRDQVLGHVRRACFSDRPLP
jgi:hypothetical protein